MTCEEWHAHLIRCKCPWPLPAHFCTPAIRAERNSKSACTALIIWTDLANLATQHVLSRHIESGICDWIVHQLHNITWTEQSGALETMFIKGRRRAFWQSHKHIHTSIHELQPNNYPVAADLVLKGPSKAGQEKLPLDSNHDQCRYHLDLWWHWTQGLNPRNVKKEMTDPQKSIHWWQCPLCEPCHRFPDAVLLATWFPHIFTIPLDLSKLRLQDLSKLRLQAAKGSTLIKFHIISSSHSLWSMVVDMALTECKSLHNKRCGTPCPPRYFACRTVVSNQPYLIECSIGTKQDESLGKQCECTPKSRNCCWSLVGPSTNGSFIMLSQLLAFLRYLIAANPIHFCNEKECNATSPQVLGKRNWHPETGTITK